MARIVPAKPSSQSAAEEAALTALESGLDDSYVVLQRGPLPGTLLVVHPDLGACAVACLPGRRAFDADEETWQGADPAGIGKAATEALGPLVAQPVRGAAFLADTPPSHRGPPGGSAIAFAGEAGLLPALVASTLSASPGVMGDTAVDALIQSDSPGAASYARGTVTDAQRRWRDGIAGQATLPVQAVASPLTVAGDIFGGGTVHADSPATVAAGLSAIGPDIGSDDPLLLLIRQAAETVAAGRPIFVQGIEIDALELTEPDFLLPALLVAAAEDWAPVVVHREGRGGFHMRLRTDRDAILGYRLVSIEPSAPLLLMLPVVDRIRRAARVMADGREEISMDETLRSFGRWLGANRLDAEMMDEIDMRIALQAN